MKNRVSALFGLLLALPLPAFGWYGPLCYTDRTTQVVLTVPSIAGETPGDVRVDYDDNAGRIARHEVRASKSVPRAHEVVLIRESGSASGVVGVIVTSPRSTTGYKFELDFQKDPSECHGAIVKATDRPAPGAAAQRRPRIAAPHAAPAPEARPLDEIPAAAEPVVVPVTAPDAPVEANPVPTELKDPEPAPSL